MNANPVRRGEYCLAFTDDKTRYVWIYKLKHKDEGFHFSRVESPGRKVFESEGNKILFKLTMVMVLNQFELPLH